MPFHVIRMDGDPVQPSVFQDLGADVRQALVAAKGERRPVVFIIKHEDRGALDECADLIVSRGTKHPAKALAPLLLGQTQIPFLRGGYTSNGQLLRSVRRLLERARDSGDNNVFLISTSVATFGELKNRAAQAWESGDDSKVMSRPKAADGLRPAERLPDARAMINLIERLPIPDVLTRDLIGDSVELDLVRQLIVRAAANSDPVLILGDTGTGKEVVARLVHTLSPRRSSSFVPVNCGAIPRELFESELFGAEKGAYTSAVARKLGLWRAAHGGTLFLDEIADLSPDHQVKILRALDSGEILPVGAEKHIHADARILAATNRDLFAMVRSGLFREDLYYRLRSFMIRTPPLRAHPDVIPAIAKALWKKVTRDPANELSESVIRVLRSRGWPGNVRELKAFLSNIANLFGTKAIQPEQLHALLAFDTDTGGTRAATTLGVDDVRVHGLQCLRHLRQADEVLRAAQVPLRDVMRGRGKTPESFAAIAAASVDRVNELDMLCAHPLLFHSVPTFSAVRRLKETLREFAESMRDDPDRALAFWKRELEPRFDDVLATIFDEVARVVKEA